MSSMTPTIECVGHDAEVVCQALKNRRQQETGGDWVPQQEGSSPLFKHVVILSRGADPVSILLSQHTYAGAIDQQYGSPQKMCEALKEELAEITEEHGGNALSFNSTDPVWTELQDVPLVQLTDILTAELERHQHEREELTDIDDESSVKEVAVINAQKDAWIARDTPLRAHQLVVKELCGMLVDTNHPNAQHIDCRLLRENWPNVGPIVTAFEMMGLENTLYRDNVYETFADDTKGFLHHVISEHDEMRAYQPPVDVIEYARLLGVIANTSHGLEADHAEEIEGWISSAHGHRGSVLLHNMRRANLLPESAASASGLHLRRLVHSSSWRTIVDKFELFPSEVETPSGHMRRVSSAFSAESAMRKSVVAPYGGAAPLSARLVELASTRRWKLLLDDKKLCESIPGGHISHHGRACDNAPEPSLEAVSFAQLKQDHRAEDTLVVFVGGCTNAEIAAIRALSQRNQKKYCVLTTGVLSSAQFIKTFDMSWS